MGATAWDESCKKIIRRRISISPSMIRISNTVTISDWEYTINAVCSQGPGGQNVNRVSTAVHLRFDIKNSALPQSYKERLLKISDQRITNDGVLVIKAQSFRSQNKNKQDAIERLQQFIVDAMKTKKTRKPTKSTFASQKRRMDKKSQRGQIKSLRGKVDRDSY